MHSDQPPRQQVGELKGRGQTRRHGAPVGSGSGQEEAERLHQLPDGALVRPQHHQRLAAQQAEDGVLREGVPPQEAQGPDPRPPPPLGVAAAVRLLQGGRVRGAGGFGHLVQAEHPERSSARLPHVRLGRHEQGGQVHLEVGHRLIDHHLRVWARVVRQGKGLLLWY